MTPREAGIQAFYADESTTNTLQGLNAAFDAYEAALPGRAELLREALRDMVLNSPPNGGDAIIFGAALATLSKAKEA